MSNIVRETSESRAFSLGTPVLVCRWRLCAESLLLQNRHMRALQARTLHSRPFPKPLFAWVKQHIEWNLHQGASEHPDGVLLLVVDDDSKAVMSVGPYEALCDCSQQALVDRALQSEQEGATTGVRPSVLMARQNNSLAVFMGESEPKSGMTSLVLDLAQQYGYRVSYKKCVSNFDVLNQVDEVFLVCDEHGIVPCSSKQGELCEKLSENYCKLFQTVKECS